MATLTLEDFENGKEDFNTISEFANSVDVDTGDPITETTTREGDTIRTVQGLIDDTEAATGYYPVTGSFEDGGTLTNRSDILLYETDGYYYKWAGTLPKTVAAASAPSDDGIGAGLWSLITPYNAVGTGTGEIPLADDVVLNVSSLTELSALVPFTGAVARLNSGGRSGDFEWLSGDYSAEVAADTLQGAFVESDTIDSSTGCWVRKTENSELEIDHFGADVDASDNQASMQGCADVCSLLKATMVVTSGYWTNLSAVDITGVAIKFHPASVVDNTNGFPFTIDGVEWSYPNTQLTRLPDGIVSGRTRHGAVKFVNNIDHTIDDFKSEDGTTWRMDNYWNAEPESDAGAAGAAVMRCYFEYGRQQPASGSGGHLVADWQIYDINGDTPSGSITEITPLSVGANFRHEHPDTSVATVQDAPCNLYNDFVMHSSVNQIEDYFSGACFGLVKWTSGTYVGGDKKGSDGISIVTNPSIGGFSGGVGKSGTDTNPIRNGLHIAGWSGTWGDSFADGGHSSGANYGFLTAIRIGGLGQGVWNTDPDNKRSKLYEAMRISDYENSGIVFDTPHPDFDSDTSGGAIQIPAGAGQIRHGDRIRPITTDTTDIGSSSYRYSIAYVKELQNVEQINFDQIASASASNGSLFVDSSDGVLKFKDSSGTVNSLY